jgi:CRP-like cAMP-binding protein
MTGALGALLPPKGHNAILEALGPESGRILKGLLSEVQLEQQELLAAEEEGVEGLYFPISGVICRLISLPEGITVKVSLAGREGMVGGSALIDDAWSSFRTVVQLPGSALFLPRARAQRLLDLPAASEILVGYFLVLLRETSLTAACNRSHTATQRLSRWLLLLQDRADRDQFPLTHESLSAMLGVRRERVSLSAQELRSKGAIEYRRGQVAIKGRSALESEACSCYTTITNAYVRFLETELERPR